MVRDNEGDGVRIGENDNEEKGLVVVNVGCIGGDAGYEGLY